MGVGMLPPELLAAILDRPADDTPRVVAADWLDEHDQPDRAELVRVQCELARTWLSGRVNDPCPACGVLSGEVHLDSCRVLALRRRECELLDAAAVSDWAAFPGFVREWWWLRGFVGRLSLDLAAWQAHAPALLAAHPLERVEVADVPGLVFEVYNPGHHLGRPDQWSVRGEFKGGGDSGVHHVFHFASTRPAMVAGAKDAVVEIVARLRDAAGDRWPGRRGGLMEANVEIDLRDVTAIVGPTFQIATRPGSVVLSAELPPGPPIRASFDPDGEIDATGFDPPR